MKKPQKPDVSWLENREGINIFTELRLLLCGFCISAAICILPKDNTDDRRDHMGNTNDIPGGQ